MTRRSWITKLVLSSASTFASAPQREEEHTLIHVFLRGGADTLNLWVPYADDRYYRLRPSLAIKAPGKEAACAIRLNECYGLHPAMRPLEAAFKEGRLGAIQSVGVDNTSGSHFECQDQMEHGDSIDEPAAGGGWLGRFLRHSGGTNPSPLTAIAIGTTLPESLRGAPSASVLEHIEDISIHTPSAKTDATLNALNQLYGSDISLLGQRGMETLDLFHRISSLQQSVESPHHGAEYPQSTFGKGLREIARLVRARLGLKVACIDLGGWDTHFFQGNSTGQQAAQIQTLAEGLAALDQDLKDLRANYTVMITTEFGRRVYENASLGTDHGRGFTLMALGDRVQGGQIIGRWPIEADDEVNLNTPGPGGLVMQTDYRHVFAEVLKSTLGLNGYHAQKLFPGLLLKSTGLMKTGG